MSVIKPILIVSFDICADAGIDRPKAIVPHTAAAMAFNLMLILSPDEFLFSKPIRPVDRKMGDVSLASAALCQSGRAIIRTKI
jgi:hypothetical protein